MTIMRWRMSTNDRCTTTHESHIDHTIPLNVDQITKLRNYYEKQISPMNECDSFNFESCLKPEKVLVTIGQPILVFFILYFISRKVCVCSVLMIINPESFPGS